MKTNTLTASQILLPLWVILLSPVAWGQTVDRYWDTSNGNGIQAGSGSWNTTPGNDIWHTDIAGSPNGRVIWTNDTTWRAVFQTGGATTDLVTVADVTAHSIVFNGINYTLSGGTITLSNGGVAANQAATINSSMAGTAGLTKTGGGTLILGGNNTYSGNTNVSAGALSYASGSVFHWNLNTSGGDSSPDASNQGTYSKIIVDSGATLSGSTTFAVPSFDPSQAFWLSDKSWSDIITNSGTSPTAENFFPSFSGPGVNSLGEVAGYGYFAFQGSTLTWTAIPEPTSALAGLLIVGGLMRRRR
jgi:fibronectin-binding autotransporter adhesin